MMRSLEIMNGKVYFCCSLGISGRFSLVHLKNKSYSRSSNEKRFNSVMNGKTGSRIGNGVDNGKAKALQFRPSLEVVQGLDSKVENQIEQIYKTARAFRYADSEEDVIQMADYIVNRCRSISKVWRNAEAEAEEAEEKDVFQYCRNEELKYFKTLRNKGSQ